ncbi:MAG: hypothetical protein AAFR74_00680 [Pseudomonadota bacterium]
MGNPVKKANVTDVSDTVANPDSMVPKDLTEADLDLPIASPARALQGRLFRHYAKRRSKLSARFITWLVIGTCAGTWIAGIGVYSTL